MTSLTCQTRLAGKVLSVVEPLPLDPAGYPGTYKLIGGRLSLDLVNTISWPDMERQHDWLANSDNVAVWLDAVGLEAVRVDENDLPAVHEVRGVLTDMLRSLANKSPPTRAAGERFNRLLSQTLGRRLIDPVELKWIWKPIRHAAEALDPVVLDAADVIVGSHDRLKHCPSCRWLFEDQTRNGRRRWCDMSDCGSRAKARSYYHRHKD
jgi:predicted RNA-binding Zn ribbon-like protein